MEASRSFKIVKRDPAEPLVGKCYAIWRQAELGEVQSTDECETVRLVHSSNPNQSGQTIGVINYSN
eukprot:scaffold3504_cov240-Pinguiococcus_pyrenoidosus.AAC.70